MRPQFLIVALAAHVLAAAPAVMGEVDFERQVEPVFEGRCAECHGPDKQKGEFRLDRLSSMLAGGESGEAAVVPGDP